MISAGLVAASFFQEKRRDFCVWDLQDLPHLFENLNEICEQLRAFVRENVGFFLGVCRFLRIFASFANWKLEIVPF